MAKRVESEHLKAAVDSLSKALEEGQGAQSERRIRRLDAENKEAIQRRERIAIKQGRG